MATLTKCAKQPLERHMCQAHPPCMAQAVPTRKLHQDPRASAVSESGSWNHDRNERRGHTGPSVSPLCKRPACLSSAHPFTPAVTRACCHGGEMHWEEGLPRESFRASGLTPSMASATSERTSWMNFLDVKSQRGRGTSFGRKLVCFSVCFSLFLQKMGLGLVEH